MPDAIENRKTTNPSRPRPRLGVHESVLVGYFCQAVGWISCDLWKSSGQKTDRLLSAINLSHNPLDPAIGDMVLRLDDLGASNSEFYIFEFKVSWKEGISSEYKKLQSRQKEQQLDLEFFGRLRKNFPSAETAHLYGALGHNDGQTALAAAPYWKTLLEEKTWRVPILQVLDAIAKPKATIRGMPLSELTAYITALNEKVEEGSAAAKGAARFAVAYKDYALHTFTLDAVYEYQLIKEAELRKQQQPQPDQEPEETPDKDDYDYPRP